MENKNTLPFPYKIEDLTPEEQEYIDKVYGSIENIYRLSRFGPKGYILYEPYKEDAANIYNMPLRPTDVFVTSYQRSGTTMTQELVWLINNNLDYSKAAAVPLMERYFFLEYFMFFAGNRMDAFIKSIDSHLNESILREMFTKSAQPGSKLLEAIPVTTPRYIKTHIPLSLLNPKTLDVAKVVYIARDPRDVAVSCYHSSKLYKIIHFPGGFKEFWNIFYKNMFVYCPIFEHVKEAWDKRHHPNMLFLFYEDLTKNSPESIRRIADFFGKNLDKENEERLCQHMSFENFKNNKAVNQEGLREHGLLNNKEEFIRKGKSGGWREYFVEEMTEQAEQWIRENLRDTDLRFPHFNIN